jgi:hypothetical protein
MIPENSVWYDLAYSVAAVVYIGYTVSVWWRRRCLRTQG